MSKFFSLRLYKEALRQTKGSGITFLILSLLFSGYTPIIALLESRNTDSGYVEYITANDFTGGFTVLAYIIPVVLILKLFNYLFKRSSSDFYHALPYTRECLYFSNLACAISWYMAGLIVSVVTPAVLFGINSHIKFSPAFIFQNIFVHFAVMMYVTGALLIAVSLVGKSTIAGYLALYIMFLPRVIMIIVLETLAELTYIIDANNVAYWSMKYNLPIELFIGSLADGGNYVNAFSFVPGILTTLLVGILFIAVGVFFFGKRKSEVAENAAPNNKAQIFIQSLLALVMFILAVVSILLDADGGVAITFIILGVISYMVYAFITLRKFKSAMKTFPGLVFVAIVAIVFGIVVKLLSIGVLNDVPAANKIAKIKIVNDNDQGLFYYGETDSYNTLLIGNLEFSDKEINNIVAQSYADTCERVKDDEKFYWNSDYVAKKIQITEKHGKKYIRNLYFDSNLYAKFDDALMNQKEYKEAYLAIPKNPDVYRFNEKKHNDSIWKSFVEEYNSLPDEKKAAVLYSNGYRDYYSGEEELIYDEASASEIIEDTYEDCTLEVRGYVNGIEYYNYYSLKYMPETAKLFRKYQYEESKDVIKKALDAKGVKDGYIDFYINDSMSDSDYIIMDFSYDVYYSDGEINSGSLYCNYEIKGSNYVNSYNFELDATSVKDINKALGEILIIDKECDFERPNVDVNVNVSDHSNGNGGYGNANLTLNYNSAKLDLLFEALEKYK